MRGRELGERDGVLDRRVGALPVMRQHGVRGVAEQQGAAAPPAAERPCKKKPPARLVAHRCNHFGDGRMPALKQRERLGVGRGQKSLFRMRPVGRAFDHREEIDMVPSAPIV